MFKRTFTLALVLGAAALAPPSHAQQILPCFERGHLIEKLAGGYGERQTGAGLSGPQQLVELWSSSETGSFTIVLTQPDGRSCVLATGTSWQMKRNSEAERVSG
ncbi:hypothetical protein DEA8626_02572 [Defluviimonas aquaemixtae]|uniref:Uncharacterized protein n=1 Tax=Albidovulum aquaemixtae TaxID=1542388 RepID=A0A2R8BJF5_9RHOB|nr:hypothetical protein [Defluviimonas aquaemixtae]SPH23508.1 hypothetical protein DEA8626_02572 [Defluviimonas aquaemixtae]